MLIYRHAKQFAFAVVILSSVFLLSGCDKLNKTVLGEIGSEKYTKAYYLETEYYGETFTVLDVSELKEGYDVIFTNDPDVNLENGQYSISVTPNTYFHMTLDETEYESMIDWYESFVYSGKFITVAIPTGKEPLFYTYIDDGETDYCALSLSKANTDDEDQNVTSIKNDKELKKYLSKWNFKSYQN